LTQRLLAFARRQDLMVVPTDIAVLIRDMKDLVEHSIGSDIEVDFELPAAATALVDPNQIELAVLNLVVNARDAMPAGGKLAIRVDEVDVTASPRLDGGRYVRITVTDTGTGMSDETLRRDQRGRQGYRSWPIDDPRSGRAASWYTSAGQ
jgi:signal transduction histidine kinase